MSSIFIDTSQLVKGAERFKNMSKELEATVDDVLNTNAIEIEEKAKQLAPVNEGLLRGQISANTSGHLRKEVNVNAFYAAYVEFGTGAYAAAYVSKLPATWQQFAAQFRGGTGGTFAEMVRSIAQWVKLKGLAGIYSVKTHKRLGNKTTNRIDDYALAYLIARSILIKGIRPNPFLLPAYTSQLPILERDLNTALKEIK